MRYVLSMEPNGGDEIAVIKNVDTKKIKIENIVYVKDIYNKDYKEEKQDFQIDNKKLEYLYNNLFSKLKPKERISFRKMEKLIDHIKEQVPPEDDPQLEKIYDKSFDMLNDFNKQMTLEKKSLNYFPTFNLEKERGVWYITGASGSGKTTFSGHLADIYHKIYPENKIYMLSNKDKDPVWDTEERKKYIKRVKVNNPETIENIKLPMIAKSLIIYDDNEGMKDKKMTEAMERLNFLIQNQGRSSEISLIFINHLMYGEQKKTRNILNEMNYFVFFPAYTTKYSVQYLLSRYFGISNNDINRIFHLNSRYVCIIKHPLCVVSERNIFLLS